MSMTMSGAPRARVNGTALHGAVVPAAVCALMSWGPVERALAAPFDWSSEDSRSRLEHIIPHDTRSIRSPSSIAAVDFSGDRGHGISIGRAHDEWRSGHASHLFHRREEGLGEPDRLSPGSNPFKDLDDRHMAHPPVPYDPHGTGSWDFGGIHPSPVPIPAAAALFGTGLAGLIGRAVHRRSRRTRR